MRLKASRLARENKGFSMSGRGWGKESGTFERAAPTAADPKETMSSKRVVGEPTTAVLRSAQYPVPDSESAAGEDYFRTPDIQNVDSATLKQLILQQ